MTWFVEGYWHCEIGFKWYFMLPLSFPLCSLYICVCVYVCHLLTDNQRDYWKLEKPSLVQNSAGQTHIVIHWSYSSLTKLTRLLDKLTLSCTQATQAQSRSESFWTSSLGDKLELYSSWVLQKKTYSRSGWHTKLLDKLTLSYTGATTSATWHSGLDKLTLVYIGATEAQFVLFDLIWSPY